MEFFWQFFAIGAVSFLIGVMLGRSLGINQVLMAERQQAMQRMMPSTGMMPPGLGNSRIPVQPNGPA